MNLSLRACALRMCPCCALLALSLLPALATICHPSSGRLPSSIVDQSTHSKLASLGQLPLERGHRP